MEFQNPSLSVFSIQIFNLDSTIWYKTFTKSILNVSYKYWFIWKFKLKNLTEKKKRKKSWIILNVCELSYIDIDIEKI